MKYVGTIAWYTRRWNPGVQIRALGRARSAIKLEGVPGGDAARRSASCAAHAVVREDDRGVLSVYLSAVPGLAEGIALAERDPRRGAREAGRLLGYPACCVDAFVSSALPGGDDLAHLRRAIRATRTRPRALLNPLADDALVPFYPCRLDCPAALGFAARVLAAQALPTRTRIPRQLATPTLTWSPGDVAILFGAWRDGRVRAGRFAWNRGAPDAAMRRRLVRALARGDSVALEGATLVVRRGARVVDRTDLAPRAPILLRWW